MRAVYTQLVDALNAGGFTVELDAHPERNEKREAVGPAAFRLAARRRTDGQVAAASHWVTEPEAAARSLVTNMLMIAEPDVRAVVDQVQI